MKKFEKTLNILTTLKLKGIQQNLDEEINNAEEMKVSYLNFLTALLQTEIHYRKERRLKKNMVGAHFPAEKQLDVFDFKRVNGIT